MCYKQLFYNQISVSIRTIGMVKFTVQNYWFYLSLDKNR